MPSSIHTSSLFMRLVRGVLLVVFVVPTATAIVNGCSSDEETGAFSWPDPNRADIDPKVCPSAEEAAAMYLTTYDVLDEGVLENGLCCYPVTPKDEGCNFLGGSIISAAPPSK